MRRITGIIMAVLVAFSALGTNVNAARTPSGWAVEEVEAAIAGGLVPGELRDEYQAHITRAEYVLLALEVLEDADVELHTVFKYPFEDIRGHVYEDELVKAFNAELINGYEDQTFRPDNLITRQEIATLVVNLVKKLEPKELVGGNAEYNYSDEALIGDWARVYIDYCYGNGIMKGIGKDLLLIDIIDPIGNTTIEQAVLLVYRLAVEKGIYSELTYMAGDVVIVYEDGVKKDIFEEYNAFEDLAGAVVAGKLYDLQKLSYINFNDIGEGYAEVKHEDGSELSYNSGVITEIRLELRDLDNLVMINVYEELVDLFSTEISQKVGENILSAKNSLGRDLKFSLEKKLTESTSLYIWADLIVSDIDGTEEIIYTFQLLDR